jgi:hypothetical protein
MDLVWAEDNGVRSTAITSLAQMAFNGVVLYEGSTLGESHKNGRSPLVLWVKGWTENKGISHIVGIVSMDRDGTITDAIACTITPMATHFEFGAIEEQGMGVSGPQLVIRFFPSTDQGISEAGEHRITFGGQKYRFFWKQIEPDNIRSTEWLTKGLCRVALRRGKFEVLWPPLSAASKEAPPQ